MFIGDVLINTREIKDVATRNAIAMLVTRIDTLESKVQELVKAARIERDRELQKEKEKIIEEFTRGEDQNTSNENTL
jgi:virulence-associated protein VapD